MKSDLSFLVVNFQEKIVIHQRKREEFSYKYGTFLEPQHILIQKRFFPSLYWSSSAIRLDSKMFIFPITSLAIVALMLIHHIDGFAPMPKKQEKSNEAIKQFLEKEKENRAGVITDMPKFDPIMVNKAANNFDQV